MRRDICQHCGRRIDLTAPGAMNYDCGRASCVRNRSRRRHTVSDRPRVPATVPAGAAALHRFKGLKRHLWTAFTEGQECGETIGSLWRLVDDVSRSGEDARRWIAGEVFGFADELSRAYGETLDVDAPGLRGFIESAQRLSAAVLTAPLP